MSFADGWDYPCSTKAGVCDVVLPAGQPWLGWATQVGYSDIMTRLHSSSAVVTTDNIAVTKYFNYTVASGKTAGRHQLWFDDPDTLELKYAECKKRGTHGVGFWTADMPDYGNGQGE